jgi:uracil phosphoribosyltransferase
MMKISNLSEEHSILNTFVSELRDIGIQKDALRFRRNLERIGEVMALEISRELDFEVKTIKTPLGTIDSALLKNNIVVATILRAGLPMHQGFLNYFDGAENAFVSAYRKYTDKEHFDIHVEYISSPDLTGKTLILIDPMLATGASFELAYQALLTKGKPTKTIMACAIASNEGVENLQNNPELDGVHLWCAAIDPELNSKSYIVPGLGDAGDLAYGIKD